MKSFGYETTPDSWRVHVAELLPGLTGTPPQFTLCSAVDEVAAWVDRAPQKSWGNANTTSLREDVTSAAGPLGPATAALIADRVDAVAAALRAFETPAGDKRTKITAARAAIDALATVIRTGTFRVALWRDLTSEVAGAAPDLSRAEAQTALLTAACAAAEHDPGRIAKRLTNLLCPSPAARTHDSDAAPPDWTDEQRIEAGAEILRRRPDPVPCVAWLTYAQADLPDFVVESGDVTFLHAEWSLGNAFGEPFQEFAHRDELSVVFADDYEQYIGNEPEHRHVVIARVDLGERSTYQALAAAAARVQPLIDMVALRTGAPAWQKGPFRCLTVNGQREQLHYGSGTLTRTPEPDTYGIHGFSDALADQLPDLAGLLTQRHLPAHLIEALRLAVEAGQVDTRDNSLWQSATITEQTVIVLQASAIEHIGALANLQPDDITDTLLRAWPLTRNRTQIAEAVEWCLRGVSGGDNPLFHQIVTFHNGRRTLHLTAAHEHREQLTAACPHPLQRARATALLGSVGDATATLTKLDEIANQAGIVQRRLKRSRNGLVHGNPTSIETVTSVRDLSRFMLHVALTDATTAISSRRPLDDVMAERDTRSETTMEALHAGRSLYEQWRSENA